MKTMSCFWGQRVSRLDSRGGDRLACRFAPASLALTAFAALGVALTPSTGYAQCGGHNERACCFCEGSPCDSGLFEICGCDACVACDTGDCCGPFESNGFCVDLHPCGGLNQRACCVGEGPPCDPGLWERGNCKDEFGRTQCGCSGGPFISAGVCREAPCGGEGERACCLLETSWGACEPGYHEAGFCEDELKADGEPICPCLFGGGMCHRIPSGDEVRRLRLQNHIDDNVPLVEATFPGTHNSYNTSADGYPFPQHHGSVTMQLSAGARVINFDVHAGLLGPILCHSSVSL